MKMLGIVHAHSSYSYDGKLPLAELRDRLKSAGMSFCCVTEHTEDLSAAKAAAFVEECRRLTDESFVFVPGFEVPYKDAHVLHIGATQFVSQVADEQRLVAWRQVSPLVVLAHPVRNDFAINDSLLAVLDGVEVWNQQYEGKRVPRMRSLKYLAELKKRNTKLLATGGLDLHRWEHFGTPQYVIEVASLTADAIVSALKQGAYVIKGPSTEVNSAGEFLKGGGVLLPVVSGLSIGTISVGKAINAILALCGLKLPASLKRLIRSRV